MHALITQKNDAQQGCVMQLNGITLTKPNTANSTRRGRERRAHGKLSQVFQLIPSEIPGILNVKNSYNVIMTTLDFKWVKYLCYIYNP